MVADTIFLGRDGTIAYQWKRGITVTGTNSDVYIGQVDDIGFSITVTVTRSNNSGSVTSPDSVTSIGGRAFSGCSGLTSVTIGNSVTRIGAGAFYGCTSLSRVFYGGKDSTAWSGINIQLEDGYGIPRPNILLINATRYYYSETNPGTSGTHWRWVGSVPTVW